MGKAKKIVIVVILLFFLWIIISVSSENISPENDKYDGLTESQKMKVKMVEEECDSKTAQIYFLAGETQSEYYAEKCEQSVLKMIEGYK